MELQPGISLNKKRGWDPTWLAKALADPARPVFLAGCVPPREGTTEAQTMEIAKKFVDRARCLAADGFVVYDIQDEASRTQEKRPFPFSRTQKPEEFAALFPLLSGKGTVVYKSVGEEDERGFDAWLARAISVHGCSAFNLVGAASSSAAVSLKVPDAAAMVLARPDAAFGCVCIAERHLTKRSEHLNMLRKQEFGALWFISQAVYDADATVQLLQDYGELCRSRGLQPAKVVLSFAPCGRPKTMQFIKWLGIKVPPDVEARIVSKAEESKEVAVAESIAICCEALASILERSRDFGVPLGVNVESVSGFREEIDGVCRHAASTPRRAELAPAPPLTPCRRSCRVRSSSSSAACSRSCLTRAASRGASSGTACPSPRSRARPRSRSSAGSSSSSSRSGRRTRPAARGEARSASRTRRSGWHVPPPPLRPPPPRSSHRARAPMAPVGHASARGKAAPAARRRAVASGCAPSAAPGTATSDFGPAGRCPRQARTQGGGRRGGAPRAGVVLRASRAAGALVGGRAGGLRTQQRRRARASMSLPTSVATGDARASEQRRGTGCCTAELQSWLHEPGKCAVRWLAPQRGHAHESWGQL